MRFFYKLQAITFFSILLVSFTCGANEPFDSLMQVKKALEEYLEDESFQKQLYTLPQDQHIKLDHLLKNAENRGL